MLSKKKRRRLYRLLEKEFRCEIMARFAPLPWPEFGDYYFKALKYRDKIRKLMFGSSDHVEMGDKWGLPIIQPRRARAKKVKSKDSLFD